MAVYDIRVPDASKLDQAGKFAMAARGPEGIAAELQDALRGTALFERWRQTQDDPDEVDPELGVVDPQATVSGQQRDLAISLEIRTTLPSDILRHRLGLLAGSAWELRNVR